ncbi:MAG: hypothetical protein CVV25_00915 [Ignavibacteriae bacterium HGW-Ignavibacteriae-4]|jgi:hypothetical protein|nr:MAG: hypothetical protein CVV25_00915 [Ignavibacteriae bacterium HGW-Ignavibacteriae-4]
MNKNDKDQDVKKILVIVMLTFTFGCSDDAEISEENSIVGKWKYNFQIVQGPSDYLLDTIKKDNYVLELLEFKENGIYYIYQTNYVGTNLVEQGKYSYMNKILTISNDKCNRLESKYEVEYNENYIRVFTISEPCQEYRFSLRTYISNDIELKRDEPYKH